MVRVANGDWRAIDELRALVNAAPAATSVLADLHWAYLQIGDTTSARESAKRYLADVSATRIEDDAFNLRRMRALLPPGDPRVTQSSR